MNKATPCTGSARKARRTHAWSQSHTSAPRCARSSGTGLPPARAEQPRWQGESACAPASANRSCKRSLSLLGARNAKPKRAFHAQNAGEPGAVRRRSNEPGGLVAKASHTGAEAISGNSGSLPVSGARVAGGGARGPTWLPRFRRGGSEPGRLTAAAPLRPALPGDREICRGASFRHGKGPNLPPAAARLCA